MKLNKFITFALFFTFLISVLSFSAFAKIEEADLDENLKWYHRISKEFTEDFVDFIYGNEDIYSNNVLAFGECDAFLTQAAYYFKKDIEKNPVDSYELNFVLNEIKLDQGGGNLDITAEIKIKNTNGTESDKTLNFFVRIGTPQKVIHVTDAVITGDAKFEKILYSEKFDTMTLDKFMALTAEEKNYSDLAEKLEPYTNQTVETVPDEPEPFPPTEDYFLSSPETSDISMIFYILAAISAVFSCSTFKRKG